MLGPDEQFLHLASISYLNNITPALPSDDFACLALETRMLNPACCCKMYMNAVSFLEFLQKLRYIRLSVHR